MVAGGSKASVEFETFRRKDSKTLFSGGNPWTSFSRFVSSNYGREILEDFELNIGDLFSDFSNVS